MGALKTIYDLGRVATLERHAEGLKALHRLAMGHADAKGGQSTNGGCGRGSCDRNSPTCAAWTGLLEFVDDLMRERAEKGGG